MLAVGEDGATAEERVADAAVERGLLVRRAGLAVEDGGGLGARVGPPDDQIGVLARLERTLALPQAGELRGLLREPARDILQGGAVLPPLAPRGGQGELQPRDAGDTRPATFAVTMMGKVRD